MDNNTNYPLGQDEESATSWGEEVRHSLFHSRTRIILLAVAAVLLLVLIFVVLPSRPNKKSSGSPSHAASQPALGGSGPATTQPSAPSNLSCADYQSVFGPNYYTQLSSNLAAWQGTAAVNSTAIINYEYNVAAQKAYDLYTTSMTGKSCPPIISSPSLLTPATASNYAVEPNATNPACNRPLAAQYIGLYNGQLMRDQEQEQAQLERWLTTQTAKGQGLTAAFRQGMVAIQSRFNQDVQGLMNQLLDIVSSIDCTS